MRWSLVFAFCFCCCVVPALAQKTLTQADIRDMQEQLVRADRVLRDYDQLLVDLDNAGDKTNKNGRSRAISSIEQIQKDVILALEAMIGDEYTIQRHGQEVNEITTQEAEKYTSGSTSRQQRTVHQELASQGVASPGYRLVRMQEIYVLLQQSRQQAIDRDPQAFDRYYRLAREFGGLMLYERDGMFQLLPPEAQEEYLQTMVR